MSPTQFILTTVIIMITEMIVLQVVIRGVADLLMVAAQAHQEAAAAGALHLALAHVDRAIIHQALALEALVTVQVVNVNALFGGHLVMDTSSGNSSESRA